jgi:hypothetical protein
MKLLCVLGAMAVAAACDDEDADPFSTVQSGHQINALVARTSIRQGDTTRVTPTITHIASGDTLSIGYTYSSANPTIASVSGSGLVTGLLPGVARIIARSARFNDSVYVDTVQVTITP